MFDFKKINFLYDCTFVMLLYMYYNYSSVVQVEDIVIEKDKNRIID